MRNSSADVSKPAVGEPVGVWKGKIAVVLWILATGFWTALCLLPAGEISREPWFPRDDLAIHFLGYVVHGGLSIHLMRVRKRNLMWGVWLSIGWGVWVEVLQQTMGWGRTFDLWDIAANSAGVLAALSVYRWQLMQKLLKKFS